MTYDEFLQQKIVLENEKGFQCDISEINPICKPHQKAGIKWAVEGGCRALFQSFGLGKTIQQLEIVRLTLKKLGGGVGLIVAPLGVRQEFMRDAAMLGTPITFVRKTAEIVLDGIYLTNYESVRDGKLDARKAQVISLDEAGILRGFGGTKTFREMMALFEGSATARFVATATPSPNEYIELLAYAAFLGIMDVSQAKTRFFKRDSTKADVLTIHPHKEKEFWLWVASWALFLQKPSDLGFSDEGYALPPMNVRWHEVPADYTDKDGNALTFTEKNGQGRLLNETCLGVSNAAREKRRSLDRRIAKMMEIRAEQPMAHRVIWHDLEDERRAIEDAVWGCATVYGNQDLDEREKIIIDFSDGKISEIGGKPCMLGAGVNFQRHCHIAIFLGIGFKFFEFIQGIHRLQRFLQTEPVEINIIYSEAEREIKQNLVTKWEQHIKQVEVMSGIIREYGLAREALMSGLKRTVGCERVEESGADWTLVNNDSVLECERMDSNSVDLILTSIPFATQYEYSPSFNDFGHTDEMSHFFEQMDYLTPNLYKILRPGRIMAIHVKDRIVPGGMTNLGFQCVDPFHAKCIEHYSCCPECRSKFAAELLQKERGLRDRKIRRCPHRFAYIGMKTIVTDVVRENNQTYRLGWTEQCKDGTKMGVGMPEYLLLFRKPPTSGEKSYADVPVVKSKEKYSRARWQFDAHGFARSSGNRLVSAEDFRGMSHADIFKFFKKHSLADIYDWEQDVKMGEALDERGMLPSAFMLLQPQSWHPDVWTDITRMRTLNAIQQVKGKQMHLCPMQFDTANRVINQFSMPGEIVFDPFNGIGTVVLQAVKNKRKGYGCELSPAYFADSVWHLRQWEADKMSPELFDMTPEVSPADEESQEIEAAIAADKGESE